MNEDEKDLDEQARRDFENLERFDKLSDEETQKELNFYVEQRREASIQKFGRDIYTNKQVGNPKAVKRRDFIDKAFDIFCSIRMYLLIGVLLIILFLVWKNFAFPALRSVNN